MRSGSPASSCPPRRGAESTEPRPASCPPRARPRNSTPASRRQAASALAGPWDGRGIPPAAARTGNSAHTNPRASGRILPTPLLANGRRSIRTAFPTPSPTYSSIWRMRLTSEMRSSHRDPHAPGIRIALRNCKGQLHLRSSGSVHAHRSKWVKMGQNPRCLPCATSRLSP